MAGIETSEFLDLGAVHTEKADDNPTNGHNARSTCGEAILKEAVTGSVRAHTNKTMFLRRTYVVIPVTTLLWNEGSQHSASTSTECKTIFSILWLEELKLRGGTAVTAYIQ